MLFTICTKNMFSPITNKRFQLRWFADQMSDARFAVSAFGLSVGSFTWQSISYSVSLSIGV